MHSFFFLLTGATCYHHAIYIVLTYFASFTGYGDDIFEGISNLHVQGSKFGGKLEKFGGKPLKKLNAAEFMEFVFSQVSYVVYFLILYTILSKGSAIYQASC